METIARIGIDTAKSVFQLHGIDGSGQPVLRRKLKRRDLLPLLASVPPTEIGLEACGASHYWAREIGELGHHVVLVPPQHVKPFVGRNKNDAADAEAICTALSQAKVRERLVAVKSAEQSALQMLLGTRDSLIRRRTQVSNTIRGYAAEFGLTALKGLAHIEPLLARAASAAEVPELAKRVFRVYALEFRELGPRIAELEAEMMAWHRHNELSRRLVEVPGIGPIIACLMSIKIPDPHIFRSGRQLAAWIGLTAQDHSSGGKQKLGGITRAGDEALRAALVCGATALIAQVKRGRTPPSPWLAKLIDRKKPKVAAVALANKTARIAWKLMVSGQRYDRHYAAATITAAA
jgi:transposase